MIHNNKVFILLLLLFFVIFGSLLVVVSLEAEKLDSLRSDYKKAKKDLLQLDQDLSFDANLESDLTVASGELQQVVDLFNDQKNIWTSFLSRDSNIYISHKSQSAAAVNANLERLFTTLTSRCKNNRIDLSQTSALIYSQGLQNTERKQFGFGFSSYIGFWPSFSNEEANKLDIQGKIIKEIIDILSACTTEQQMITLNYIKRESVGRTDDKHIGIDKIDIVRPKLLLREKNILNSFLFEVSFMGITENARSFINNLRPPFSVRKFKVNRVDSVENELSTNLNGNTESNEEILPIIRDIKSIFTFTFEYIYDVNLDADFLLQELEAESAESDYKNFLNVFRESL